MPDAVCFIDWQSYVRGLDGRGFFSQEPLSFNSRQERLHNLQPGDTLWLVSRYPEDRQYYFVAVLRVGEKRVNDPESTPGREYGQFGIVADRKGSHDLGTRFPGEGLLRCFTYETGKPIRHGASLGQAIQTIRFLSRSDSAILNHCLWRVLAGEQPQPGMAGLWTKCDRPFADYFLTNWQTRRTPQAFFLFDSPPALSFGAPVFIHSDQSIRLVARFRESLFVASYEKTVAEDEQQEARQHCWARYRSGTEDAPSPEEFDDFWKRQDSVRSLMLLDNFEAVEAPPRFRDYSKALEWGYPMGVGWRPLNLFETYYLMGLCQLDDSLTSFYLRAILR